MSKRATAETIDRGTPQTRARLRGDPVDELAAVWRRKGYRNAGELEDAAREIRRIYTLIVASLMPRATDLHGVRGVAAPAAEWLVQAKRDRYDPWAREMGRAVMPTVVDWLIEERPFRTIDRARRQRDGRAVEVVEHALTRYAEIAGWLGRIIRR